MKKFLSIVIITYLIAGPAMLSAQDNKKTSVKKTEQTSPDRKSQDDGDDDIMTTLDPSKAKKDTGKSQGDDAKHKMVGREIKPANKEAAKTNREGNNKK